MRATSRRRTMGTEGRLGPRSVVTPPLMPLPPMLSVEPLEIDRPASVESVASFGAPPDVPLVVALLVAPPPMLVAPPPVAARPVVLLLTGGAVSMAVLSSGLLPVGLLAAIPPPVKLERLGVGILFLAGVRTAGGRPALTMMLPNCSGSL